MSGYTKLFNSIIASTIWSASDHTRIVWITMLAMANRNGIVEASLPGLAVLARVAEPLCREAVNALESPDPDSRSAILEGRRITKIDGGWQLVNYAAYRQKLGAEERREYKMLKQREYRSRPVDNPVDTMSTGGRDGHIAEAEAEAEAKAESQQTSAKEAQVRSAFDAFWASYPRKHDRKRAFTAWRNLSQADRDLAVKNLDGWLECRQWRSEAGRYVPYAQKWLNRELFKEDPRAEVVADDFHERASRATAKK